MAISHASGSRLRAGKFHDGEVVDGRALAAPCIVIDVGINSLPGGWITGDVDFEV